MRFLLIGLLLLSSCASVPKIVRIECPQDPKMLPVKVKDGAVSGPELTNTIKNHKELWKHIRLIKTLGCQAK